MGEYRKLQAARILACYELSNIFSKSEEDDIEKGRKAAPDGTKSKDGKWIKQAGKWVPFKGVDKHEVHDFSGDKHEARGSSDHTKEKSNKISFQECNTVMLPTKDKTAPILAYNNPKKSKYPLYPRYFTKKDWANKDLTKHHLYVFNLNEEIKKGDWVYDKSTNKVFQVGDGHIITGQLRKIIASTDESLKLRKDASASTKHKTLPGMSSEFIKEYCKSGGTGKVHVEYEQSSEDKEDDSKQSLKVSSDNTISIKSDS